MRDEHNERYPPYLPFYWRFYLVLRKFYRQTATRLAEKSAQRQGPVGIVDDGEACWTTPQESLIANPVSAINKAAFWLDQDMARPEIQAIAEEINHLKATLRARQLAFTTTAGTFISRMFYPRTERTKLWENSWTIYHSAVKSGHRVLDIGGASTAFAFYLASLGCSVSVIDNDWSNCGMIYNTNYVGKKMGWDIKAYDHDVAKCLPFPDNYFDRVFSICVVEHLTSQVRRFLMKELARVVKPAGIVAVTTDYDHKRKVLLTDKGLRFAYRQKFDEDIIKPSGLKIYGNTDFIDAYPQENFLGAVFLKKDESA